MRLELIGHKLCPFVQRVSIILLHKDIPHLVTYVDLDSPPDWLIHLAPLGKVPVLRVDNDIAPGAGDSRARARRAREWHKIGNDQRRFDERLG